MLRHWVNGGCFLFFKCHINQWKKTLLQTLILPNVPSINNEGRCARKLHSFINMFLHIFPMLTWTHCHNHTFALIIKDLFWAQNCLLWLNISVLKMNYYIQFTYTSSLEEKKSSCLFKTHILKCPLSFGQLFVSCIFSFLLSP